MAHRIHQEIVVATPPERVYRALTDAAEFSRMTGGAPTEIDAQPGGAFSLFGGMIHGRTVEAVAGERLVQAWRVKTWAPGAYSVVRFALEPTGEGTRLVLDHAGFPEDAQAHLEQGWKDNYLGPLGALARS